jgi:TIR domain
MAGHHFISYSGADARDFAFELHQALEAGPPHIPAWLDKKDIMPGRDRDAEIAAAVRDCASLLFVMSKDSVEDQSGCKPEWTLALKYKTPVIPLLYHRGADLFAILSADRDTTLEEILTGTATPLPENLTEALVGEAFSRLDPTQQRVM